MRWCTYNAKSDKVGSSVFALKEAYYTFLFSYYGAGIEFADMCRLTYKGNLMKEK